MTWTANFGRLAVGTAAIAVLVATPACGGGGGGNHDACNKIKGTVTDLSKNPGSTSASDLGKKYKDAAVQIRGEADGGSSDLKTAAGHLADTLDSLGTTLTKGPTSIPDTSGITQSGVDLQKICGN